MQKLLLFSTYKCHCNDHVFLPRRYFQMRDSLLLCPHALMATKGRKNMCSSMWVLVLPLFSPSLHPSIHAGKKALAAANKTQHRAPLVPPLTLCRPCVLFFFCWHQCFFLFLSESTSLHIEDEWGSITAHHFLVLPPSVRIRPPGCWQSFSSGTCEGACQPSRLSAMMKDSDSRPHHWLACVHGHKHHSGIYNFRPTAKWGKKKGEKYDALEHALMQRKGPNLSQSGPLQLWPLLPVGRQGCVHILYTWCRGEDPNGTC